MARPPLRRSSRRGRTFSLAPLLAQGHRATTASKAELKGWNYPSHSNQSKVVKPRFSGPTKLVAGAFSKSRPRSIRHDVVQGFKATMEDTRQRIVEEMTAALAGAEQDSIFNIKIANSSYSEKQESLQARRRALLDSFQPATYKSSSCQQSQENECDSRHLADRLGLLSDTLDQKRASLDVLWNDWVNIQQKIYNLGVEMLGPDALIRDSRSCNVSKKKVHTAAAAFKKQLSVEERMYETREKQSTGIEYLASDTLKQLAAQEKTWLGDKESRRDQMLQLAKQMMACL